MSFRSTSLCFWALGCLSVVACGADTAPAGEEATEDELGSFEPVSALLGNPPNFAQASNGNTLTVVARSEGRGAKAGALVELFYPKYATDNLWDSYVGVRAKGVKLKWAHDLTLKNQRVVNETGLIESTFERPGLELVIQDVMRPTHDAHVRHVVVKNTSAQPLQDFDVAFYAYYMLHDLPTGDRLWLDDASKALVQQDGDIAVATLGSTPPVATHCGNVLWPLGKQKDARSAAEANKLAPCTGLSAGLQGVNGVLVNRIGTIAPGATGETTFAIGMGADPNAAIGEAQAAIAAGFAAVATEDAERWSALLGRARMPATLPLAAKDVYKRALITTMQHRVTNGAFIAAPTLTSPVYRFVWPRDGSKTAVDLLEAGLDQEAKDFFAFLETLLKDDGSFAVNYYPDGSKPLFDFGKDGNENDQPGMLPWGVDRVFSATSDAGWLAQRWPAVRRVAEHLLVITPGGRIDPSRDLWELETGSSWTYAAGSAVAGLEAAGRIANEMGAAADGARYAARAAEVRTFLETKMVTAQGYWSRGLKGNRIDDRVEIANLALASGGFKIYVDTDPKLSKLADLVQDKLLTRGNGVRRYDGDAYYGGHPWPVAAEWLAMHRLATGDRDVAEGLFATMTEQARATDSLMLGEQFDEENKVWVSSMPLVWSEAAYIHAALTLYGEPVE